MSWVVFFFQYFKELKKKNCSIFIFARCIFLIYIFVKRFVKICEKNSVDCICNFCSFFNATFFNSTENISLHSKYMYISDWSKKTRWSWQIYSILSPDREYWSYLHLVFSLSQDVSCAKWRKFRKFEKSKTAVYRSVTQQHVLSQLKP